MKQMRARVKQAELTSGVGASVLGFGLGVLFAANLRSYALLIVALGALLHGWGMWDKHRLERTGEPSRLWWDTAVYWVCWVSLIGLALYMLVRQ
jgi:hypothetical protein